MKCSVVHRSGNWRWTTKTLLHRRRRICGQSRRNVNRRNWPQRSDQQCRVPTQRPCARCQQQVCESFPTSIYWFRQMCS